MEIYCKCIVNLLQWTVKNHLIILITTNSNSFCIFVYNLHCNLSKSVAFTNFLNIDSVITKNWIPNSGYAHEHFCILLNSGYLNLALHTALEYFAAVH